MERLIISPRPDWTSKVEALGLTYHTSESGPYWDESVCYHFTSAEIDRLEAATNELHRLCLAAAGYVIEHNLFSRFCIPQPYVPLILSSWEREDLSLFGRFDLFYNGAGEPKLYEYNADTPTSLIEAAVVQWYWLEELYPRADQFNSLHEKLLARWRESGVDGPVHFTCLGNHEDLANTRYMQDLAAQAGFPTKLVSISDIGWNGRFFVDLENHPIRHLFKLYPWEWLIDERFSRHLLPEPWRVAEPAWKMLLSNKALLPLLWELFPGHQNLLPAFHTPKPLGGSCVRKPLFGREGASITLQAPVGSLQTPGDYGEGPFIYQAACPPPNLSGYYPVLGTWIARDEAAGLGIRESSSPITTNLSRFIPHYFT